MGKEFKINTLEEMCDLMCDNKVPEVDGMTIGESIDRLKVIEICATCKSDLKCEKCDEAQAMAVKALETLQKIIDLDTYDQPMDAWTGIEYVKRIVEEVFGEVGEQDGRLQ